MTVNSSAFPAKGTAWYGWALALATTLFFSIGPVTTKFIIDSGVEPVTMMVLRYVASTLLLVSTVGIKSPVLAGLIFSGSFFLFASALVRISASVSSMIVAIYPLFVLVILALRGEKFTYRNLIRMGLGLLGIYFLIGLSGRVDLIGAMMVLGTALTYAIYLFVIQSLKDYDGQTVMLYIFATISLVSVGLWFSQSNGWRMPSAAGWLGIGVLVIFTTYLAQLCLFAAVRLIGSGQMAMLYPVEVLLTITWAALFLGEHLTITQGIGGVLIFGSLLLALKRLGRARYYSWRPRLRLRL